MSDYGISFENVSFAYGKEEVLHNVSAKIISGEIIALFGPNGSGKTTLLKCLAGLFKPQSGDIFIQGKSLLQMSPGMRSQYVCYVPQEHAVSFAYTVEEVVLMGRTPYLGGVHGPGKKDYQLAHKAMESIGIQEIAHLPYTELSGGQRQMVLIARALAQECDIMILDEPTSALDFKNQIIVWKILKQLKSAGKTILVCTHDPNHVMWFCNRVLALKKGSIIANGEVKDWMNATLMEKLYGSICTVQDSMVVPTIE